MRRACERGLKIFDYGRSKQDTGSYSFKKNWGFEPQPLHYEYRLYRGDAIPQNNPANPEVPRLHRAVAPVADRRRQPARTAHRPESGMTAAMRNLLYLVHRLPFPPNKGDKLRSYHLLKHLAATHRVFLGTFVDDPEDERHVEALRPLCAELHVERLDRDVRAAAQPRRIRQRPGAHASVLPQSRPASRGSSVPCASSASTPHSCSRGPWRSTRTRCRSFARWCDFVDVDSAKWTQYARIAPLALVLALPPRRGAPAGLRIRRRKAIGAIVLRHLGGGGAFRPPRTGMREQDRGDRQRRRLRILLAGARSAVALSAGRDSRSSSPARWIIGRTSMR